MHLTFYLTYGEKLFLSPLTKLRNALDVGTGTGIWAIDLGEWLSQQAGDLSDVLFPADENPECQVTGIDLSPNQPNL